MVQCISILHIFVKYVLNSECHEEVDCFNLFVEPAYGLECLFELFLLYIEFE